ncbi:response regulator transcription factor [Rhodococcus pseudokoreensis]|uniref:Response regulator transcription factor n=1 Tax=Rhodococcus pseudokoreensis TaxID=2811421 RepID=A0A974W1Z8_9NOCA|nr:response regulator transcription factor [Rhodococcus pseudokoreensis]QSE89419.1 response regulator transcription factor [Rhodococcus pseudokoreensis]
MDESATTIRVLLIDDHAVVRRGITSFLASTDDIVVAAEAGDGVEALDKLADMAAHQQLPDVALLDLVMPRMDGVETAKEIAARYPSVRVVVLTSFGETERVHAALANGASGYLLKDADPSEVEAAIRASTRDEVFLDTAIARQLTHQMITPAAGLRSLSARERDVLILVARGMSNRAIATELSISERTARTHVGNVLAKMHLNSRTQAALVAVREGLVQP